MIIIALLFCYRTIKNTDIVSNHGKGLAIDINPIQNPHVVGDDISPKSGYNFKDRSNIKQGMIIEGDDLYNAFIKKRMDLGEATGKIQTINILRKN